MGTQELGSTGCFVQLTKEGSNLQIAHLTVCPTDFAGAVTGETIVEITHQRVTRSANATSKGGARNERSSQCRLACGGTRLRLSVTSGRTPANVSHHQRSLVIIPTSTNSVVRSLGRAMRMSR